MSYFGKRYYGQAHFGGTYWGRVSGGLVAAYSMIQSVIKEVIMPQITGMFSNDRGNGC